MRAPSNDLISIDEEENIFMENSLEMAPEDVKKTIMKEVEKKIVEEANKPLVISIMGQTGVGKSSLINALFNTNLETNPVRPCTKSIQKHTVRNSTGHELWFYDLPGIGESEKADEQYIIQYRKQLLNSDVVLWAIHADNRSLAFDVDALGKVLALDNGNSAQLMSKITFVLTKADLIAPPPWLLAKTGDFGMFVPRDATMNLLDEKSEYCQEVFIRPYSNLISSKTYNDSRFKINEYPFSCDKYMVRYQGFMSQERLFDLKTQFPHYEPVFDRLYDNYRVIPCSSLFRFNLSRLMLVIINKLGPLAIDRFSSFCNNDKMNMVSLSRAKNYCNLIVFDAIKGHKLFDLNEQVL